MAHKYTPAAATRFTLIWPTSIYPVLAEVIATLDHRHFRVIRPLTPHSAFRLLPADVP
jgi:hypothetical protein